MSDGWICLGCKMWTDEKPFCINCDQDILVEEAMLKFVQRFRCRSKPCPEGDTSCDCPERARTLTEPAMKALNG